MHLRLPRELVRGDRLRFVLQSRLRSLRPIGAAPPAAAGLLTQAEKQAVMDLWVSKGLAPPGTPITPPSPAELAAFGPQTAVRASAPAPSAAPGFWESASDLEKVAIVGGGLGAALLLYLALKKKR